MSLRERVHTAEHQGREVARQGFTRASLEEAQSRLRRKMRIHPRTARPALPLLISLAETHKSAVGTQPIISVNGEDLPPDET
ncbi:MAG TPA: hypothetical protein VF154_16780 [Terriglobales bacterium]|jgi:hypothetical protein